MKRWLRIGVPALIALLPLVIASKPGWREAWRQWLLPQRREILATVEGDVLNDGSSTKVIKFRDRRGLTVEIFRESRDGVLDVVDRIALPDRHDGLVSVRGQATRLAIADVDEDGKFELVAPSFDNQLVPHLNVFRYNPALSRFEAVQPEAGRDD